MQTADQSATTKPLPYGRQWIDDEDIAAVVEVLRGDWLTQGPHVADFEQALAEYCGTKYAVAVNSGTSALHIAALAAGVGTGDVGITSPITFVASANCIAYCGGTPRLVDINPATANIDAGLLDKACAEFKPKVIIPVDFTGQPADLPEIYQIAQKHGALVIEDAAHSLGASYFHDGEEFKAASCVHTDMAILSFHPVKHITTGEGGAVLTNNDDLYKRLSELRTHGITKDPARLRRNDGAWYYEQHSLGLNYRITDFQCALGLSQMRRLDEFIEKRRALVEMYKTRLAGMEDRITLLTEEKNKRSSYHLLVALIKNGKRRKAFDDLYAHDIRAQVHYIPVNFQPWHQESFGFREGDCPQAETYYEQCLTLPLFPQMSESDVDFVVSVLEKSLS